MRSLRRLIAGLTGGAAREPQFGLVADRGGLAGQPRGLARRLRPVS